MASNSKGYPAAEMRIPDFLMVGGTRAALICSPASLKRCAQRVRMKRRPPMGHGGLLPDTVDL